MSPPGSDPHPRPGMRRDASWAGLVFAPTVVLANLSINQALVNPGCAAQTVSALHAVSALSLVLTLAATMLSWRTWQRTGAAGDAGPEDAGDRDARRRFASAMAVALGALSSLVVVAMWIPVWVLSPCAR